jgi:hypothetical protein
VGGPARPPPRPGTHSTPAALPPSGAHLQRVRKRSDRQRGDGAQFCREERARRERGRTVLTAKAAGVLGVWPHKGRARARFWSQNVRWGRLIPSHGPQAVEARRGAGREALAAGAGWRGEQCETQQNAIRAAHFAAIRCLGSCHSNGLCVLHNAGICFGRARAPGRVPVPLLKGGYGWDASDRLAAAPAQNFTRPPREFDRRAPPKCAMAA